MIARRGRRLRDPGRPAARGRDHRRQRCAAALAARPQRHALAAKVVVAYERPFWQDRRTERARRDRVAVRLDLAAGRRACCRCSCRRSASRRFWRRRRRRARQTILDGLGGAVRRAAPARRSRCSSGPGASIRSRAATSRAGRPGSDARRAAARHPRAAVLRRRLGPLGGRLHGGRRPDRSGGGAARRCGADSLA